MLIYKMVPSPTAAVQRLDSMTKIIKIIEITGTDVVMEILTKIKDLDEDRIKVL